MNDHKFVQDLSNIETIHINQVPTIHVNQAGSSIDKKQTEEKDNSLLFQSNNKNESKLGLLGSQPSNLRLLKSKSNISPSKEKKMLTLLKQSKPPEKMITSKSEYEARKNAKKVKFKVPFKEVVDIEKITYNYNSNNIEPVKEKKKSKRCPCRCDIF